MAERLFVIPDRVLGRLEETARARGVTANVVLNDILDGVYGGEDRLSTGPGGRLAPSPSAGPELVPLQRVLDDA